MICKGFVRFRGTAAKRMNTYFTKKKDVKNLSDLERLVMKMIGKRITNLNRLFPSLFFYPTKEVIIISASTVWDKEYATSFKEEMLFLKDHGIRYTWVTTNEHGISVWKYKKTVELFKCLTMFYENTYYK